MLRTVYIVDLCNVIKKDKDMEQLTKEEIAVVKGGRWIYDEENKQWCWVEPYDLGDPDEPNGM